MERPIHLQFESRHHPQGLAFLGPTLTSQQAYDIYLDLHLPRTPNNCAVGNFMLDLSLLSPNVPFDSHLDILPSALQPGVNGSDAVLGRSRRPAILTYASSLVNAASTLVSMPWYILGWSRESEALRVPMFEAVEFARGSKNVPDKVRVVIEDPKGSHMQFYEVMVRVRARFKGLRWILYNYMITSFLIFTSAFYAVAMASASLVYLVFVMYHAEAEPKIKQEQGLKKEDTVGDAQDSQLPLQFPRRPVFGQAGAADDVTIKTEEAEEAKSIQPLGADADDEDEDEYAEGSAWRDSGIGTGRDDEERRRPSRRRRMSSDHGDDKA